MTAKKNEIFGEIDFKFRIKRYLHVRGATAASTLRFNTLPTGNKYAESLLN